MSHDVIMPALGMNQTTGKIIAWLKREGDLVNAGEPLMEVETDKAIVEVEAQAGGVLTEIRHAAGSEVPVGRVIALIGETVAPAHRALTEEVKIVDIEKRPAAPSEGLPVRALAAPSKTDRILISPKARREAARRGIDLSQLTRLGKSQPYHVGDLNSLQKDEASRSPAERSVAVADWSEFGATIDAEPTLALAAWASNKTGKPIGLDVIWAAFAAGSLGGATKRVRVCTLHGSQDYEIAPRQGLSKIVPATNSGAEVDLVIHNLLESRLSHARIGSEREPSLTLIAGPSPGELTVTLRADEARLSWATAMQFLDAFVRRVESPLRHLL